MTLSIDLLGLAAALYATGLLKMACLFHLAPLMDDV